mgnify:CR=1 FL=1
MTSGWTTCAVKCCVDLYGTTLATAGIHVNLSLPDPLFTWDFGKHILDAIRSGQVAADLYLDGTAVGEQVGHHAALRQELRAAGGNKLTSYALFALLAIACFLQVYNVMALAAFWPFFGVIVALLLGAMYQFVRLVLTPRQRET